MKILIYIYSYSSYLLDVSHQKIQYEQDYVEKGLLPTEQFAYQMHVCVDGTPSMSCTICEWFKYHSPQTKIYWFFVQAQWEFCALCRQVSSCLRTTHLLLAFFAFFQYGLIDLCWVRTETMVCLTFKKNLFTVHLVRIVCKPYNVIKVCIVCQALYHVHTCFFKFVKGMCRSTSSDASDTCVAACLIGVVFTFIEGVHHSTSGDISDEYVSGTERGWWT